MSETNEPEVLAPNIGNHGGAASVKSKAAPQRAWFPDEAGFTGEPIEYGGQKFYAREVKKSEIRRFSKETQRLQREAVALNKEQQDELKTLQSENEEAELPDERAEYYENEGERLMDALDAVYNEFLGAGMVGWDLPRPFSKELLFSFEKVDRVALCNAIGERSTSGFTTAKNSSGRSNR